MNITVESLVTKPYFPLFSSRSEPMDVAHVVVENDDDRAWLSLSQREGDNGLWVIDAYFRNGVPVWCHSDGERLGTSQVASGELADVLNGLSR